jgi:hypothetical protein
LGCRQRLWLHLRRAWLWRERQLFGGGGGGGYYGGGGACGDGGGGGSDYCASSVSSCAYRSATRGPSVTIQYLAPQSISFPATAVTYGQADFSPASADSGLVVSYSNPSGQCSVASNGLVKITGAGSCTVTASQAGDNQYAAASPVTQTFSIDQAVVHVDASAASTTYGSADPIAAGVIWASDLLNGDPSSVVSGSPSCQIGSHSEDAGS